MNIARNLETGSFAKLNTIFEKQGSYDILYIGSSRTAFTFNPSEIDLKNNFTSYNCGLPKILSRNEITYGLLKTYLSNCKENPKYVVMNIDFFLWETTEGLIPDAQQFFPYMKFKHLYNALLSNDSKFFFYNYFKIYRITHFNDYFYYNIYRNYKGNLIKIDKQYKANLNGFQRLHTQKSKEFYVLKNMKNIKLYNKRNKLKSIFQLCKEENIKLIPIITPAYKSVIERVSQDSTHFYNVLNLCNKFDCKLLNFMEQNYCQDSSVFFDELHLNKKGLKLFLKDFSIEMREIIKTDR